MSLVGTALFFVASLYGGTAAQVAAEKGWTAESNAAVNVAYQPLNEKKLDAKTFPSNPVLLALILTRQSSNIDNAYGWYRAQMGQRNVATYIVFDLLRADRVDLAEEWMQRMCEKIHEHFGRD